MSEPEPGWREELIAYLREQARPLHKFGHQPRLYALTREIAATHLSEHPGLAYDDDVVFAAAYLHDLGVFAGHRPEDPAALAAWDHVAYACAEAPRVLKRVGFPQEKVAAVLACIREHQPKDEPQGLEATVLRDADILEQLGAIGVMRTVTKVGSDTRFHTFADAQASLEKALATLPGIIRLDAARDLARARIAELDAFLRALVGEGGANLG